ncbi:MAG TPA: hypothetical protein VL856_15260 [Acidimicrobiia bacterium]|jgi:hypothetical protein|nr:hypothetical protein [Acidimicrobiia bacterium]
MNLKKLSAAGITAALLVAVPAGSAFADDASSSSSCAPAYAQGRPTRDPGVRVWNDGDGWHVRVTHNSLRDRSFAGEIVTKGEVSDVQAIRLEGSDVVKTGPNHHKIVFRFNNYGGVDGFDFTATCNALAFGFLTDGQRVPLRRISIGHDGTHPKHNPFVIRATS